MTFLSKLFAILSSAWGLFIFSNSLKTGVQSSGASDPIVSKIISFLNMDLDVDIVTTIVRKLAHFSEFLLLGLLISLSFYYIKKRFKYNISTIMLLCMSTGLIDEFLQSFVAGRSSEVLDVIIDFSGALVGLLIVFFIDRHSFKKGHSRY